MSLTLDASAETHVVVYDVLGRNIAVLHDGPLVAGTHRFRLIARRLPPGLYLVRAVVAADGAAHRLTRKLVLTE